jgi:hypothetical protein
MSTRPTRRAALRHSARLTAWAMPLFPERYSRAVLGAVLGRAPGLWGWTQGGDRQTAVELAFESAFPGEDAELFLAEMIPRRARALATSMTYMARYRTGRDSGFVGPLRLPVPDGAPCVITYLHYAIDPVVQLILLRDNTARRFRWVVYPPPPNRPLRWEDERELYLAGGPIPTPIADTFLYVTRPSWPLEARRHLNGGGGLLIALDSPIDARRGAGGHLRVGEASMPISPAIDLLAGAGARLLFVWPEPQPDQTWELRCAEFADTAAVADAASRWIRDHRDYWAAWSGVAARIPATSMRVDGE